jgi:ComF family protein
MAFADVKNVIPVLLDAVFPRSCPGCGIAMSEPGLDLCWDCRANVSVIALPLCDCCGEAVNGRVDHTFVCQGCVKSPPFYRRARAAIHYNTLGKRLVTQFKYSQALWLEKLLVDLLESCVLTHFSGIPYDMVCAVPLHPLKRRERGYNQAALLTKALAKRLDLPMAPARHLIRTRMTPSQTRLTARQRLTNVMAAFEARTAGRWNGRRVLLVDDVMTTGATVSACAKALRNAGVEAVDVVTVARGI